MFLTIYLVIGILVALVMHTNVDIAELKNALKHVNTNCSEGQLKFLVTLMAFGTVFTWPFVIALAIAIKVVR